MKKINLKLCLLVMLSLQTAFALPVKDIQAIQETPVSKTTVENRLNNLFQSSVDYNDVKLVKKTSLEELRNDFLAFITKSENDLLRAETILNQKMKEINNLKISLQSANNKISEINKGDTQIAFFGVNIPKDLYHAIMWTLVLSLIVAVCFLTVRFKRANEITQNSKTILVDLEDEFETFKRNAIEREQKLRRQLQDEINKQRKLADVS
jgi:hypothetical protein